MHFTSVYVLYSTQVFRLLWLSALGLRLGCSVSLAERLYTFEDLPQSL
jgi:hypothetical protein